MPKKNDVLHRLAVKRMLFFKAAFKPTTLATKLGEFALGEKMDQNDQGISEGDLKTLNAVVDEFYYEDEPAENSGQKSKRDIKSAKEYNEADLASLRFAEDIKILLIPKLDYRVMCYFLGCNAVKDVQSANYKHVTMIGEMSQQCVIDFMKVSNHVFAGEVNFHDDQPVPVVKQTWHIDNKDIVFTIGGYLFFEASGGNKKDNIVAYCWNDPKSGLAGITFYGASASLVKEMVVELENYTKQNNCIRGAKLRDINMSNATFSEVVFTERHSWENYYFPKNVREMFKLEVFGFLNATERYNAVNIHKRGILLFGNPGVGKTTCGYILCNEAPESTVIWITPDLIQENNNGKYSIKLLYMLADFVSPTVIFLEDLDLFGEDRDGTQGDIPLGALMNILDGVNQVKNAVTIATTNRLELIEKALSNRPGRFDRVVEIPVLSETLRRKMFTERLSGCIVDEGAIDDMLKSSDGWTGAECQEYINSINLIFIQRDKDKDRHVTREIVKTVSEMIQSLSKQATRRKVSGFVSED